MTGSASYAEQINATFRSVSSNVILDEGQAWWFEALLIIMDNLKSNQLRDVLNRLYTIKFVPCLERLPSAVFQKDNVFPNIGKIG